MKPTIRIKILRHLDEYTTQKQKDEIFPGYKEFKQLSKKFKYLLYSESSRGATRDYKGRCSGLAVFGGLVHSPHFLQDWVAELGRTVTNSATQKQNVGMLV